MRWVQIRFWWRGGGRERHRECVFTQKNYKETWKDVEMLSQVFFPWKEVYETHPDDEQQLAVHYFLEKTSDWPPCRSESIKTELLTIAFLSCWSLGLNPNFIRPEKRRIMRTMGALEVDLGLMLGGRKGCQSVWWIGSHALVPGAKQERSCLFWEAWCATWGQNLSACGANVSDEAKVQSIIYTESTLCSESQGKHVLTQILIGSKKKSRSTSGLPADITAWVWIILNGKLNQRREFRSSWDIYLVFIMWG